MYTKNDIAKILVRRDNITMGEALDIIEECQTDIDKALASGNSFYEIEDILIDDLRLEMDFIWAFL